MERSRPSMPRCGAPAEMVAITRLPSRTFSDLIAGNRPSAYAKVKVAAKKDGTVTAVDAEVWGTGGNGGYNPPPLPYVFRSDCGESPFGVRQGESRREKGWNGHGRRCRGVGHRRKWWL